ncbi:MAG: response regulator [Oscillospiraceae bacterium]|nr:response regulator [Oscillospiraceae bacterium]
MKMRTITIDDNQSVLDSMRHIMQNLDPDGTHYYALSAEEGIRIVRRHRIDIAFLDMEMPGMSGDETMYYLRDNTPEMDIVIITGHPEYALLGHRMHCSGFVTKPFDEADIIEALQWLRKPVALNKSLKINCTNGFTVESRSGILSFQKKLTQQIFAYLCYKNGISASNDELLTVFYDGDITKQDQLRKYTKDMRDTLSGVGAEDVLNKKRGEIGVFMDKIETVGELSSLPEYYGWIF